MFNTFFLTFVLFYSVASYIQKPSPGAVPASFSLFGIAISHVLDTKMKSDIYVPSDLA